VLDGLLAQPAAAATRAAADRAAMPPRILNPQRARIYPTVAANRRSSDEWC
jgi:hypothetical protein